MSQFKFTNEQELFELYKKKYKEKINNFYYSGIILDTDQIIKLSLTGSTYRAFKRKNKTKPGMIKVFENVAKKHGGSGLVSIKSKFINDLYIKGSEILKLGPLDKEWPRLAKMFNLYANYYVAFFPISKIEKVKILKFLETPLDKYSLYALKDMYNISTKKYKIINNPSMGSIHSKDMYKDVQNYLSKICNRGKLNFCPVFIDFIQAGENNLDWYDMKRIKKIINKINKN